MPAQQCQNSEMAPVQALFKSENRLYLWAEFVFVFMYFRGLLNGKVGFSKETFYLLNDYCLGGKFILIVEKLFMKSSHFIKRGEFPLILSWSLTVIKGKIKRKLVAVRRMQAGQPFGAPTLSGNGLPAV